MGRAQRAMLVMVAILLALAMGGDGNGDHRAGP